MDEEQLALNLFVVVGHIYFRCKSKMYSCDWLELSTPTNKLATYFGDDKPTSRSVLTAN